jgi:hypothetical protein
MTKLSSTVLLWDQFLKRLKTTWTKRSLRDIVDILKRPLYFSFEKRHLVKISQILSKNCGKSYPKNNKQWSSPLSDIVKPRRRHFWNQTFKECSTIYLTETTLLSIQLLKKLSRLKKDTIRKVVRNLKAQSKS